MHLVLTPVFFPKKKLDFAAHNSSDGLIMPEMFEEYVTNLNLAEHNMSSFVLACVKTLQDLATYFHTSPKGMD